MAGSKLLRGASTGPCSMRAAPGGPQRRSCMLVRQAASAPASAGPATSSVALDNGWPAYVERAPRPRDAEPHAGPAAGTAVSTSGRTTAGQALDSAEQRAILARRNLAVNGHYMLQVRMLGNIFSRARSSSRESPAAAQAPKAAAAAAAPVQSKRRKPARPLSPSSSPSTTSSSAPALAPAAKEYRPEGARTVGTKRFHSKPAAVRAWPDKDSSKSSFFTNPKLDTEPVVEAALQPAVVDILDSMTGTSSKPLVSLVSEAQPAVVHRAMLALADRGLHREVQKLVRTMEAAGRVNEHTHAVVVAALDRAGHFELALAHVEDLQRRGVDIGPVCASMLMKLCSQRRDLRLALDIFHRLYGYSTLNRFAYNCLIHLCAVLGNADEAVHILGMMREDESPDTMPDGFTYGELLKAVVNSERWPLLPKLYREMLRSQVRLSPEHWTLMITAAGRANDPALAQELYKSAKQQYRDALHIDNALLSAVCRHASLTEMLAVYRNILADGLHPDDYTFNAILTTMCKFGASLYAVEDLLGEMYKWGVKINTYTGTSLINAYRRAPELNSSDPRTMALLLEKVHDVLSQLVAQRQANSQTFGLVMALHAELGDAKSVYSVLQMMRDAAVPMEGKTCMTVAKAFRDGGFVDAAQQFLQRTRTNPKAQAKPAKRRPAAQW